MSKLYYGNGECTIEGSGIGGVEIKYRGKIAVEKTASDSFVLIHRYNKIIMFPISLSPTSLNNLFDYVGEFKITSVIASSLKGRKVDCTIHRIMDYAELLDTTAETMTTKSENLSATYISKKKKAIKKQPPIIKNLKTTINGRAYYLKNGEQYSGVIHAHLDTGAIMTGGEHTKSSEDLYVRKIIDGKMSNELIATRDIQKIAKRKYNQGASIEDRKNKDLKVRQKIRKKPKGKKHRRANQ